MVAENNSAAYQLILGGSAWTHASLGIFEICMLWNSIWNGFHIRVFYNISVPPTVYLHNNTTILMHNMNYNYAYI